MPNPLCFIAMPFGRKEAAAEASSSMRSGMS